MHLHLRHLSKRFNRQWVIEDLSDQFPPGSFTGIRGGNGSGKSTLLRMLAGQLTPSRGTITHSLGGRTLPVGQIYAHVSWTGPYLEVVEEMTLLELLTFHFTFIPPAPAFTAPLDVLRRIGLDAVRNRKLEDCSSGMRQRVLLATALYADTPLLLLDEPTLTLDEDSAAWFYAELERQRAGRTTVLASNDPRDLVACDRILALVPR